jgi:type II secretory pathway pseudopilin PulG
MGDESGFTLIEMMVVCVTLLVVVGATMAFLVAGTRVQNRDSEWAFAVQNGQTGLARMMREIRQATNVNAGDGSYIDFNVVENSQTLHVAYYCNVTQPNSPQGTSYSECVRLQAALGAALPALSTGAPVIVRLKNPTTVFSYNVALDPSYVTATIQLPSTGNLTSTQSAGVGHNIVLSSGAYLRNAVVSS